MIAAETPTAWRVRDGAGDVWLALRGPWARVSGAGEIAAEVAARRVERWFPRWTGDGIARAMLASIARALGEREGADARESVREALRSGRLRAFGARPVVQARAYATPRAEEPGVKVKVEREARASFERVVTEVTVAAREVATFGEDLDAAQVAANKRLAARLGIPFCEVCLRKKKLARARAEKAAVERATFPANLDAARSAESKKLAARLGIPFCEICVKKAFEREKGGGAR